MMQAEDQDLAGRLHTEMIQKTRYTPPPPEEAHLYELGVTDMDLPDGSTLYGIPTWFPKAEAWAWEEARFNVSRWRKGHA